MQVVFQESLHFQRNLIQRSTQRSTQRRRLSRARRFGTQVRRAPVPNGAAAARHPEGSDALPLLVALRSAAESSQPSPGATRKTSPGKTS